VCVSVGAAASTATCSSVSHSAFSLLARAVLFHLLPAGVPLLRRASQLFRLCLQGHANRKRYSALIFYTTVASGLV